MEIVKFPNDILRQKAVKVEEITDEIIKISEDMLFLMRLNGGIGLAANQVGILKRIIVVDTTVSDTKNGFQGIMINPEIIGTTAVEKILTEGCLSFPKQIRLIKRPFGVKVKFFDKNKKQQVIFFAELTARVILHEMDHLDGKLFIDYANNNRI